MQARSRAALFSFVIIMSAGICACWVTDPRLEGFALGIALALFYRALPPRARAWRREPIAEQERAAQAIGDGFAAGVEAPPPPSDTLGRSTLDIPHGYHHTALPDGRYAIRANGVEVIGGAGGGK